ncbi:hypothetical protein [Bosea sp. 685]|uniref:hypothetical protein n=1 Tax=Bosea sp. 685 TaxID=3080057 RepID=UPI0028933FC1|nr:hypothetical protein [Bosea sp. 685]WNJ91868.1 hypothetical protein RMR04_06055 [Bosea sp. 685]
MTTRRGNAVRSNREGPFSVFEPASCDATQALGFDFPTPGEELLWVGRPHVGAYIRARLIGSYFFACIGITTLLAFIRFTPALVAMALIALLLVLAIVLWEARRIIYVATDAKLHVLYPRLSLNPFAKTGNFGIHSDLAIEPDRIEFLKVHIEPSGVGSVYFTRRPLVEMAPLFGKVVGMPLPPKEREREFETMTKTSRGWFPPCSILPWSWHNALFGVVEPERVASVLAHIRQTAAH